MGGSWRERRESGGEEEERRRGVGGRGEKGGVTGTSIRSRCFSYPSQSSSYSSLIVSDMDFVFW